MILKLAKAGAGAIKIQCAILSRSGACQLNMSPASGFDYPHIRIEPRESTISAESCKRKRLQICAICKEFFLASEEVSSRVKCPIWKSNCLANAITCGGVRSCKFACSVAISCRVCNRTIAIRRKALSATCVHTLRSTKSDTKFGARNTTSPCESRKREDICAQHCCESVSGKCDREFDYIRFPFCALRQSAQAAATSY